MVARDVCPRCETTQYKKNRHIHNGKQNHQCKACGRQFGLLANPRLISDEQRALIERLFLERISLRGICHAVGIGLKWLLGFLVERCDALSGHLHTQPIAYIPDVTIHRLDAEADEMWSFVGKKANKQRIWLAMDAKTRQVMAFHVGDRGRESAKQLWVNIPAEYQQHATSYTDLYEVYTGVIPPAQHKAMTKQARKTNHIERFNNTLRQCVSRLVRETISFSKKLANHIGAIRYFICHYNLTRATALHG
jgi:IS1 family transposase